MNTIKNVTLILTILLILGTNIAFTDHHITRGPDVGEIYFVGPTSTGEGIYHSTDYGETATCMDSTLHANLDFLSICADLTPGVLYGYTMPENLYISYSYGQQGTWVFRSSGMSYKMNSGVSEGFLYNGFWKHSEDYGLSFIQHSYNGYFGTFSTSEIDNDQNIGYVKSHSTSNPDSTYFFISYDNFENLELQNIFSYSEEPIGNLTRGFYSGELYTIGGEWATLRYSNNYGFSWEVKNTLYFNNVTDAGIVGGRQPGEIYVLKNYIQFMWQIAHTYIYHSLDYGETFTIYHPFSHGPEPYIANFEATPTEGTAPLTVQFKDFSSGENLNYWEWDFQTDGIIDSYEQNPEYTYQDTGYYSVSLTINYMQSITATRYNYIHVTGNADIDDGFSNPTMLHLDNIPNPFSTSTTITYTLPHNIHESEIEIYNVKGQLVNEFNTHTNAFGEGEILWNGKDLQGKKLNNGIYFYKVTTGDASVTHKMIMMR